jgi:cyclase
MSSKHVLAIGVLCLTGTVFGQDLEDVVIKPERVTGGIYMLTGAGGNMGLSIGPDGALLIDDQYAPLTERIQAAIKELGDQPVRFVLNTHWHGDHTGGNENFGKTGAVVVAHDNVRKRMSAEQFNKLFDRSTPASVKGALPIVTFNDTATFHFNAMTLRVMHLPSAHTDGDSIVHFLEADVIHAGDVFFNGQYPYIDVDAGGSIDGVIEAVSLILDLAGDQTKIIPGHGALSNRKELASYLKMLETLRGSVASLLEAGKSEEEILAAGPTAAYDDPWGQGFLGTERFVKILVRSLSEK